MRSLASVGCAQMLGVAAAAVVAVGGWLAPPWTAVPVEVETATAGSDDLQAGRRVEVERLLAERSSLPRSTRQRVARAVVEEAADADLDPVFVIAVMGVESELDAQAVSSCGARGLMQVRDRTANYLDEKEQLGLAVATSRDPALNVRLGVRYLHRLTRAFGDLSLALVAYNSGPHRVSSYLREGLKLPDRLTDYPRRVRSHYRRLMDEVAEGALRVEHPLRIRLALR